MSLPHALLGLLKYMPNTGYTIKTAFESSINFFWDVSLPQIYRTLNSMEDRGWLQSNIEQQESKPNKKIYHVTPEGDREFQQWLAQKPEVINAKDELLVKLFFGNFMDREVLISHIEERRNNALQFFNDIKDIIKPAVNHYVHAADAPQDTPFWLLTMDFGKRRAQMIVEWCDSALEFLKK